MENIRFEYKKAEIIETAKTVFAEKGYSAVTMKDISEACKIGRSSLYHYFSSVDKVYDEVIMLEKYKVRKNTNNIDNFLNDLKNELMKVDKSLYKAVTEHLLANKVGELL